MYCLLSFSAPATYSWGKESMVALYLSSGNNIFIQQFEPIINSKFFSTFQECSGLWPVF